MINESVQEVKDTSIICDLGAGRNSSVVSGQRVIIAAEAARKKRAAGKSGWEFG
jgi:hypothetical protein